MKQDDFDQFSQMLAAELEIRGGKPMSQAALMQWWRHMERYDLEQVAQALSLHSRDAEQGRFMPQPADLIRHMDGTMGDRAAVAWGTVMQHMQSTGAYSDIDFGDPAIHATVHDLGGWPTLCRTDLDELGYLQRRFCNSYRAYSNRGVLACPLVLSGDRSPDSDYEKRGLPAPKPVMVTDRSCAEAMKVPTLLQRTVMSALPGFAA